MAVFWVSGPKNNYLGRQGRGGVLAFRLANKQRRTMFCIPVDIPPELCLIDDERKAIYHSKDSVCIWVFANSQPRDQFVRESAGMSKAEREVLYERFSTASTQ